MPFTPVETVPVELLPDGRFRVLADVTWTGTRGDTVLVAAGTVTDLASVPWFMRSIVATGGHAARAAIVHDVLCDRLNAYRRHPDGAARPVFSPVDTDGVFRLILAELGVPAVKRWLYWTGVRWGALGNPARRAGWWSTAPLLAAGTLLGLLVLPAALGSLLSGLLLALVQLAVSPFDPRPAPRRGDARRRRRPLEHGGLVGELRAGIRAQVDAAVDEAVLGTPEQRANPQPVRGLLAEPEHVNNPARPLPEHDWKMPHHLGGTDGFHAEGWPEPRPPMDAHGCPPNCPRRLEREARLQEPR